MSRTVLVMGATVTSPRYGRMESCVRMRTGCLLSGRANLYRAVRVAFLKDDSLGSLLRLNYRPATGPLRKLRIKLEVDANPPAGAGFEICRRCAASFPAGLKGAPNRLSSPSPEPRPSLLYTGLDRS